MAHITLITGGQRSGKSRFAQELALKVSEKPVYLATARVWDDDFSKRIERHKNDRGPQWQNVEIEKEISSIAAPSNSTIVIDCITLWMTNIYTDYNGDIEISLNEAKAEWEKLLKMDFNIIAVTNEIGMGLHAETEVGRNFVDLQGWINQFIASKANEVYFMVSGIPLKVK